jgi:hypothetical protein
VTIACHARPCAAGLVIVWGKRPAPGATGSGPVGAGVTEGAGLVAGVVDVGVVDAGG